MDDREFLRKVFDVKEFTKTAKNLMIFMVIMLILTFLGALFPKHYKSYEETIQEGIKLQDELVERNHQLEREAYEYNRRNQNEQKWVVAS